MLFFFLNIFSIIIQNGVPSRFLKRSEAVINSYSYYSGDQKRIKRPTPTKFSRTTNPILLFLKAFHSPLGLLALAIIDSDPSVGRVVDLCLFWQTVQREGREVGVQRREKREEYITGCSRLRYIFLILYYYYYIFYFIGLKKNIKLIIIKNTNNN